MYKVLGWPALVGVASLFLATPVTLVLAKLISDLMATQMKVKDERLRVLSEIISGMRVVKLFAWEMPFTARVLQRREEETKVLQKKGALGSGFSFLWNMIPFMVGFVAFACHAGVFTFKALSLVIIIKPKSISHWGAANSRAGFHNFGLPQPHEVSYTTLSSVFSNSKIS